MLPKPIQAQESYSELLFPQQGMDLTGPYDSQAPGSTALGTNVRVYEALTNRGRGGSRAGFTKYIPKQVNGSALIQHLNVIVDPQGPALAGFDINYPFGWAAPNRNLIGGIGGFAPLRFFDPTGTGTPTTPPTLTLTLTVGAAVMPDDGTTTTITVNAQNHFAPAAGVAVVLRTTPAGAPGDQASGLTDANGNIVFTVSDTNPETVVYVAFGPNGITSNAGAIDYSGIKFVQVNAAQFANTDSGGNVTLAFTQNVTAGNLLVVIVAQALVGTYSVSDSLGNRYRQPVNAAVGNLRAGLYWTIANATGECLVTVTATYFHLITVGILEYLGVNPADPIDGYTNQNTNTDNQSGSVSFVTGSIAVGVKNELILAAWGQADAVETFTPQAGWTTRVNLPDGNAGMALYVAELLPANATQTASGSVNPGFNGLVGLGVAFKPK